MKKVYGELLFLDTAMDTLFEKLEAGDFLTFIALCIATFAFLCTYASFPKNFLEHLAFLRSNPKRDNREGMEQPLKETKYLVNPKIDNNIKILKYFFLVDLFTAWILVFLIFSISISCEFLISKLQLALCESPYKGLRICLFFTSIIYGLIMGYIFIFYEQLRRKDWPRKSRLRWIIVCFVLMTIGCGFLIYFSLPCWRSEFPQLGWIIISILGILTFLFICLVIILAWYTPLTELAIMWDLLKKKDESNRT